MIRWGPHVTHRILRLDEWGHQAHTTPAETVVEILREQQTGTPSAAALWRSPWFRLRSLRHRPAGWCLERRASAGTVSEGHPSGHQSSRSSRCQLRGAPLAGCVASRASRARRVTPQGGCALHGRGDGGDGAAMGEHGEALPLGHLPQQGREGAIGLGCAHTAWMERGAGVSQEQC
jgi:hypothetical protein